MSSDFQNRTEAGRILGERLGHYADQPDVIVLGLPRGGVPVAFEVAKRLRAPLDVVVVRKLGSPRDSELAMGALAEGGVRVLNQPVLRGMDVPADALKTATENQERELERRVITYRKGFQAPVLRDKTVILVDDGIATGSVMRAAIQSITAAHPARLVAAVPTSSREAAFELRPEVDELVVLLTPEPFFGVGGSYADFRQTSDEEVCALLHQARSSRMAMNL